MNHERGEEARRRDRRGDEMSAQRRSWLRLGILAELVARSNNKLGRTALMKLAFLLQTVRGVPLGYNFRLYTYGPYDGDVLDDLGQAEAMKAVESSLVAYSGGYGYEFQGRSAWRRRLSGLALPPACWPAVSR